MPETSSITLYGYTATFADRVSSFTRKDIADSEINKVDIFVRRREPTNGRSRNHWSNVVSFIEVKAKYSRDLKVDTATQCLRHSAICEDSHMGDEIGIQIVGADILRDSLTSA